MKNIINTRADLDALQGTQAHADFMARLRGSMTRREDQAAYPDDYNDPGYTGKTIDPVWVDVEDLTTIKRFGFSKKDFK